MVIGCAGAQKMTKPLDTMPTPKKFDLGELHFKWIVAFPLEIFIGTLTGTLFMTPKQIEQMALGMERLQKKKGEESRKFQDKNKDWLHK